MDVERTGRSSVRISNLSLGQRLLAGVIAAAILLVLGITTAVSSHPATGVSEMAAGVLVFVGFTIAHRRSGRRDRL